MAYTDEFDAVVAQLASDWDFFECYITVDDPLRLSDARVALARANGRPIRTSGDHDFEVTVAHDHGRGARGRRRARIMGCGHERQVARLRLTDAGQPRDLRLGITFKTPAQTTGNFFNC